MIEYLKQTKMKTHLYDKSVLEHALEYIKDGYKNKGIDGALCGYVRRVTANI